MVGLKGWKVGGREGQARGWDALSECRVSLLLSHLVGNAFSKCTLVWFLCSFDKTAKFADKAQNQSLFHIKPLSCQTFAWKQTRAVMERYSTS